MSALWNAAVAHHQAGRLAEAQALYRQVLAASPRHFDATHLLGVIALQQGALDDAERLIKQALEINSKVAAAHGNLGTAYLRAGRLDAARASLERAVKLQPGSGDALVNLGTVLHRLGRAQDAATVLRRAVAANAKSPQAHNLLGAALLDAGDARNAVRAFEAAVRLQPDRADFLNNLATAHLRGGDMRAALESCDKALALDASSAAALGVRGQALAALGRSDEARPCFERAVALDPASAAVHANRGAFLRDEGALPAAIASWRQALTLSPGLLAAQTGLIHALRDQGNIEDALALAQSTVADHPNHADAHAALAAVLAERGESSAAAERWRNSAALPDAGAETHLGLANALMAEGRAGEAMQHYQRAVRQDGENAAARWAQAMTQLKPIYADMAEMAGARSKFASALAELNDWFDDRRAPQGHKAVGSTQPFYLAYQASNNRELLGDYGRLCARLMSAWPFAAPPRPAREPGAAIRVGIASAHVRDHSVWNAITRGWIRHLDRQRFELHVFQLGRASDAETARTRSLVKRFIDGPRDLRGWVEAIRASALDVLIYPEIGMDAMTTRLAALRLAPLQAATWGHPETTGLPTIDLYLSAQGLEPEGAQAHYTERLVTLPNLGVCCEPLAVTPVVPDLEALGLSDSDPLLLCAGTPFKYSPAQDAVWATIARRLERGQLVFFSSRHEEMNRLLVQRLRRAFAKSGADFDVRVRFIPTLDRPRFFGLMQRSALMLDTLGFSGFNTALQGIECGLPVVAREGEFMRGRLASGIMHRLGLDDMVAGSDDSFVDLCVRLAHDDAARLALRREIENRRAVLFNDLAAVRGLESALEGAVDQSRRSD